jgi:hypothetical protein
LEFDIAFHSFSCMFTPDVDTPPTRKVATVPLARQRLRREAAALRRAAHPNVVRLRSFVDLAERTELQIDHAGEHTLVIPPPDGATAVACAASLVAAVADLHSLGIAHGRLTADHVVVAPDGRAVLCGLSAARPGDPTPDVRALGPLLELLASGAPQPGSRRDRRAVTTLLAVAERARVAEPVPDAAELAAELGSRPRSAATDATEPRRDRRRVALGVVAVGVTTTCVWLVTSRDGRPQVRGIRPPSTVPTAATTVAPEEPAQLAIDGATYAVGQAGDVVVTGDWDCDGVPGAALLQPGTGAVFAFDHLATPGERVEGRPITTIDGATTLEVIRQPDGCDSLVVRTGDGRADVLTSVTR